MPTATFENHARRRLAAGELVLCMGVNQLRTPNVALIASACGFDAIYIDLEHNPTSLETAAAICVAATGHGVTPIARIPSHDAHDAARILDCGAQGVMVPHVNSAEEARAIVAACRFAPLGHRSAAGTVPALGYAALRQPEINRRLNAETLVIAMLETPEAIEAADAIAAVAGIDMLHIGSTDLSTEMGIPGRTSTTGCARRTRRRRGRRGRTARASASAACGRIPSSRPGCCGSACATSPADRTWGIS